MVGYEQIDRVLKLAHAVTIAVRYSIVRKESFGER